MSKIHSLIRILQSENEKKYKDAYDKLILCLKEETDEDVLANIEPVLAKILKRDFNNEDIEISKASVSCFSQVTRISKIFLDSSEETASMILVLLFTTAPSETIKECFSIISEHPQCQPYLNIIQTIHDCIYKDGKTAIPDVQKRLILDYFSKIISATDHIKSEYVKILQIILAFIVDENVAVRKSAVDTAEKFLSAYPTKLDHIPPIANCLKLCTMKKIKSYTEGAELLLEVLTYQCPLIMKIMGTSIRKSSSVINALLSIIEKGFQHPKSEIKAVSFKVWDSLINCFAENLEVLSSSRYLKLLMQPLTAQQTTDELNIIRIETLWSLARKLGTKLPALFTTVCLPIIHSCLGNLDPERLTRKNYDIKAAIPVKSRLSGVGLSSNGSDHFYAALHASGYRATPKKASKSRRLQLIGVELLVHMLQPSEEDVTSPKLFGKFKMLPLTHPLLTTVATFVSHSQLLITAVSEVLCYMTDISEDIAWLLWSRLIHHVKLHLETNIKKKKRETEVFNFFLQTLQNLVSSELVSASLTFRFIRSFLELPEGILSSTFYGGSLNGMHGVPVLCLLRLLFDRRLISTLVPELSEEIENCGNKLIACGFENKIRILSFCQSVVDIMQSFANLIQNTSFEKPLVMIAITNLLLNVWGQLGKNLNQHIVKSQEVNQGDNLDHDFSAMYSFLLFPICLKPASANFMETWTIVYKTFLWCSSFVTTCKPNELCNHFSSAMLKEYNNQLPESLMIVFANICKCIISNAEFNHGGFAKQNRMSYIETVLSPCADSISLPGLDKHKNLENFCALLKELFNYYIEHPNSDLVGIFLPSISQLFTSIHHGADIRSLFCYFASALKTILECKHLDNKLIREVFEEVTSLGSKAFSENNLQNESVVSFFTDTDVAHFMSSCFQAKDRKIKNLLVDFWSRVVVEKTYHNEVCDVLSDDFKTNMFQVYKQMGWECPWKDIELPNSIEPPVTGPSQDENDTQSSIPPAPGYGAFGSPMKKHSFLPPKESPKRCSSPAKTQINTPTRVKRKLGAMSDKVTYVKCHSPFPKPNTPLTEHQKEKKRQRGFIPTMYNKLDETQEESDVITKDIIEDSKIEEDKENSPHEDENDIIKTSQADEETKPKKKKTDNKQKDKRKISLKAMSSIKEEDDIVSIRRSGRLRSQQSIEQAKKIPPAIAKDDKNKVNEDEESIASENDSLTGESASSKDGKNDENMDTTAATENGDASYEYIEIADASTNQTYADISTDDVSDDGKDLGVTPLDDSYEYVAVADMSVNVTRINQSISMKSNDESVASEETDDASIEDEQNDAETTKDASGDDLMNDTAESEYEAVAMVDMSTNPANATADDDERDTTLSDIEEEVVEEEVNTKKEVNAQKMLPKRSLKSRKVDDELVQEDVDEYISSDGEEETSFEIEDQNHKSFNETEYEYVEVADISVFLANDDSVMDIDPNKKPHEQQNNDKKDCSDSYSDSGGTDVSVCVVTDNEMDETAAEVYIDARSSLEGEMTDASMLDESKTSKNDVINISGESSASGDLFETSAESNDKSIAEHSVITLETSENEEEVGKSTSNKEVADIPKPDDIPESKNEDQTGTETHEVFEENKNQENKCKRVENSRESLPLEISKSVFKIPTLTALRNEKIHNAEDSPSAKGILKRRITIGPVSLQTQSPNTNRRVSFAEPMAKSKRVEKAVESFLQSPRSSLIHRKKHSPRTVNRRLSLQPEKKANEVQMSPHSLRSVRVAQAIANIRARDPSSPSSSKCSNFVRHSNDAVNETGIKDLLLKDLEDPNIVSKLSKSQLKELVSFLLKTTPNLHNALMNMMDS